MMRELNRAMPRGQVQDYQTFQVATPRDGAIITACKDAGCQAYAKGWTSIIDERTQTGRAQAHYIRWESGRDFAESKTGDGLTVFRFKAFQRCFAEHRTRPEIYVVRHGDWRGNPSGRVRQHQSADDWVEHFAANQQALADQAQRGMY